MRFEVITSAQNPKIKDLLALQEKSRLRREKGLFVVEGVRELMHCIGSGYEIDTLFTCPAIYGKSAEASQLAAGIKDARIIELTEELYAKVAYRATTEGLIAEVKTRDSGLDSLRLGTDPLIVVLESVEKPGNLGAVLRSADAAGADAVIICDPYTDLYNPNLIRSSIGAIFTTQCIATDSQSAIDFLKKKGVQILTAQLQDSSWYYDTDMKKATAIVIGTEATGLTDIWREAADAHIKIPMLGRLDSLNASVSASVLLYEAVRQRHSV